MAKEKVLQDWMENLTWKQQSTIISASRGPDAHYCPNIKKINKWIRRITQNNADSSTSYMQDEKLPALQEAEKEFEFCTIHYALHLLQGLEIIGYKHPIEPISAIARDYYLNLANILCLNPETENQMDKRLEDKIF